MLSELQKAKLKKINAELKKFGVLPLHEGLSKEQITQLEIDIANTKKSVMESADFNSYHTNPDYACALLVQEAINIIYNKGSDSPEVVYSTEGKNQLKEMRDLYESFVAKHGVEHATASKLKSKLTEMECAIYENATASNLKQLLKESAGKAQTIMSAKGLQDDMIDFQAKVGDIQNKYVDSFIAMVNDEYGADTATDVQNRLMDSLDELMKMVRKTKNDMLDIVNILSGNAPSKSDSMVDVAPDESIEDIPEVEPEAKIEPEVRDEVESEDDELSLDLDDLDVDSGGFERKE